MMTHRDTCINPKYVLLAYAYKDKDEKFKVNVTFITGGAGGSGNGIDSGPYCKFGDGTRTEILNVPSLEYGENLVNDISEEIDKINSLGNID